jgi:hypothetical protein
VQITPPTLVEVKGTATKQVSNGTLEIEISVTPGATGWPSDAELNYYLLELFTTVAAVGWVGTVGKQYVSAESLVPDPPPEPEPIEPPPGPEPAPTE